MAHMRQTRVDWPVSCWSSVFLCPVLPGLVEEKCDSADL